MNPTSAYRETAIRGAGPVRLVVLLYEQMIEDLRQAVNAIKQNQIELRTNKINHAISVIGYLQSSLNKQAGGQVALNLEFFYEQLRGNLAKAQFCASQRILLQQITDLLALREAWSEVERAETVASRAKPVPPTVDRSASTPRSFAG
ncbi:MAG TPA: flagellar export chaperone FliS [Terriglobales bacterium]|jgi:flagellar protein FliS|nr:flagellar export chaperone FliS [Terriglobales bacterium]